jgi:hypothetical protein
LGEAASVLVAVHDRFARPVASPIAENTIE